MLRRIISAQLGCGCKIPTLIGYRSSSGESINEKFLNVAIIGAPNAGKSTLVNNIVGNKVSVVTEMAHTTRNFANGIINIGDTQLVLTDTPGVVSFDEGRRLKMHKNHIRMPNRIAGAADVLAVVHDISSRKTKSYIDDHVLHIMSQHENITTILIVNKIDRMQRKEELLLLSTILNSEREKDEWGYVKKGGSSAFVETFFTCAHTGDGTEPLLNFLLSQAKPSRWEYSDGIYSDSSIEVVIAEVFREKLIVLFGQEIPFQVKQETVIFNTNEETQEARIHQKLTWPKKRQRRYVSSKEEELKNKCLDELEGIFKCKVKLSMDISQKSNLTKDDVYY